MEEITSQLRLTYLRALIESGFVLKSHCLTYPQRRKIRPREVRSVWDDVVSGTVSQMGVKLHHLVGTKHQDECRQSFNVQPFFLGLVTACVSRIIFKKVWPINFMGTWAAPNCHLRLVQRLLKPLDRFLRPTFTKILLINKANYFFTLIG